MAFSATVYNTQYVGPGKVQISGIWSGTSGDSSGTMSISGTVTSAVFQAFDDDSQWQIIPRVTISVSGGISTVTINNQDNVTAGYFTIDKLGQ
jgi:hypothetical protein